MAKDTNSPLTDKNNLIICEILTKSNTYYR